jgi:hypothetical protein
MPSERELFTAQHVKIVSIDVPFWQLATFLLKVMLAAIPALVGFAILWTLVGAFVVGLATGRR